MQTPLKSVIVKLKEDKQTSAKTAELQILTQRF